MQYAKDDIRQRLLETARKEFLEKGFEKASIRTITTNAKTAKSNLYNYFRDKDDLFCWLLQSTTEKIRQGLESAKQFNVPKGLEAYTLESQSHVVAAVMQFVTENHMDIRLLLFKAQGSTLENFKYEVLDAFTDNMCSWVKSISPGKTVSRLLVGSICSFYLSLIEQSMLKGKPSDMQSLQKEFTCFVYHGWKGILQ